jgi:hypothetical protein
MYQEERVRHGNVRPGNPLPEEQILTIPTDRHSPL